MKRFFSLVMLVLVTGCAGEIKAPPLAGERIDAIISSADIQVDPTALNEPLFLAPPLALAAWNQTQGTADHYPAHISLPETVRQAWQFRAGGGADKTRLLRHTPVIAREMVYLSNTRGEIQAVSLETGKIMWQTKLKPAEQEHLRFSAGLAVTGGHVIATLTSGDIYALDAATGAEKWHTGVGVAVKSSPAVAGDFVIVTADNSSVYALSAADGKLLWHHNGIHEPLSLTLSATPAIVASGQVVIPYDSGEVYVLDVMSGSYLWHESIPVTRGSVAMRLQASSGSPVVADGVIYLASVKGGLSAFSLESGRRLWTVPVNSTQTPWVTGSVIYVIDQRGQLVAINRKLGKVRWVAALPQADADQPAQFFGPILAGERLFITASDGRVLSVDPRTGEVLSTADFGGEYGLPPVAVSDHILLYNTDAKLILLK